MICKMRVHWLLALMLVCGVGHIARAEDAKPASEEVSYHRDIKPIFQAHCQGCHQPAKPRGTYVMTAFETLLKGGESETAAIVPGNPEESYLLDQITPTDGEAAMPKDKPPLSAEEIEKITNWIRQGAKDDTPAGADVRFDAEHPPQYASLPIITSVEYSPDGSLLAVSGNNEVLLHKADGSELVGRLIGMSERIESAVFSLDGKRLAVVGGSPARVGEVQIWDVASKELLLSVPVLNDTIYGASWSPDSKYVAFGCPDNSVRAIDADTGEQVLLQRAPNDWTLDTVFSVDGSHLVSVGRDMAVKLIEFKTQRFIDNITSITPGALRGGLTAVDRHPTKDEIVVGGDDGAPRTYRMHRQTKRVIGDDSNSIRIFPAMPGRVFAVAYSPDGTRIACGSSLDRQGHIYVYSADYNSELPADIKKIESKRDGNRSRKEKAKLAKFYASNVEIVAKLEGLGGGVYGLTYSPDGKTIASGGFDGRIRINDAETGKLIKEFVPVPLTERTAQKD